MNRGQARTRLVQASAVLLAVAAAAGCGSAYRPVVTPINSTGPATQARSYVVVVSAPSPSTPGIATIVDYSGDTVLAEAPIGPGPYLFSIDENGNNGYTVNSDGTISNFPISTILQAKQVVYFTLASGAKPVNLYSPSAGLWAADLNGSVADVFTGSPLSFGLAIPLAPTPVYVTGPSIFGQRDYGISQNIADPDSSPNAGLECNLSPTTQPAGSAVAIETSNHTTDTSIPLGRCPVFAIESPDTRRLFVLNRGDDTITVINSQNNTPDQCSPFLNEAGQKVTCHPSLPLSTTAGLAQDANNDVPKVAGPVYAEYVSATSQLVVADYAGGAISVIDVSEDEYGNDSPTFGTTFTIPVGNYPASVTVLNDGSRAYTANQTDQTVTVVLLSSHTVEKTLPVTGHPRTVVSTQNSEYGKVYVAAPDTPYLTIISTGGTDPDIVDTTILVEGNVVDVRTTNQTGSSGNANIQSRTPGYGQPCYLPPAAEVSTYGANYTLQNCRTLP